MIKITRVLLFARRLLNLLYVKYFSLFKVIVSIVT